MISIQCAGDLVQSDVFTFQCSTPWEFVNSAGSFDPLTLDPVLIAGAFGAGFFSLTSLFVVVMSVKYLIRSIDFF